LLIVTRLGPEDLEVLVHRQPVESPSGVCYVAVGNPE